MKKLCIPTSTLDQHMVVLGKTGAGKSSALRHIVEHLLRQKKRVCIIDPKGDWWGLKSSADGKSAGFPVIAFGDFKETRASDVPINQQSGKHVAELITTGNRPCIIGFRGWMTAHMVRFWIDFASGVFNTNVGELYLVIDECHNFAPKGQVKGQEGDMAKCLHWSNRLMAEGRGLGIVCLIASQRPQKVHNDTLTSCETLVAMRVIHAADRGAVEDWIEGCGDPAQGKVVLNSLAGMARGEAFVWSPEAGFGPERVRFPMFTTFDSFAPPQLQKKVSTAGWADVDLDAVKEKLAQVIEESKANDPSELRREIAKLKQELAKKPKVDTAKPEIKEVPVLTDKERSRLTKLIESLSRHYIKLDNLLQATNALKPEVDFIKSKLNTPAVAITKFVQKFSHKPVRVADPEYVTHKPTHQTPIEHNGEVKLTKCARVLLATLVQHGPSTKRKLSLASTYSIKSSGFANALSELRGVGAIEGKDVLKATEDGIAMIGEVDPLPTGGALRGKWIHQLGKCPSKLLEMLIEFYPNFTSRDELAAQSGYSETSSGFVNSLSELRGLELIEDGPDKSIKAADELFAND